MKYNRKYEIVQYIYEQHRNSRYVKMMFPFIKLRS